jgi:hypothetical protein
LNSLSWPLRFLEHVARSAISSPEDNIMLSEKPSVHRNKIDLHDAAQIRILKRRLKITEVELRQIVEKVGDSIVTVSKEVEARKPAQLASSMEGGNGR